MVNKDKLHKTVKENGKMNTIKEFQGINRFLSNFWPVEIAWGGRVFPSVEHAFQAMKCANDKDKDAFTHGTARQAKRLGRSVTMRKDWNSIKLATMYALLVIKFKNPELRKLLLDTGNSVLQEGNYWHDTFWGVDLNTGSGANNLGKLLMKVRKEIQEDNSK